MKTHFADYFEAADELNVSSAYCSTNAQQSGITLTPAFDPARQLHVPIECIISPDAKMANVVQGHVGNGAEHFCTKCDVSATVHMEQPLRIWPETTTEVRVRCCGI